MPSLFDPMGTEKGLRLEPWYRAVKQGKLLPPIQACINPVHGCDLSCVGCEFAPDEGEERQAPVMMPDGHLVKLVEMLADWGVKTVTFGTVGEPTLHWELPRAIIRAFERGMGTTVITTSKTLPEATMDAIIEANSDVWVKIPAAKSATYELITRMRAFYRVKDAAEAFRRRSTGNRPRVGWLFEITALNHDEVDYACHLAHDLHFDAFYARPRAVGFAENRPDAKGLTNGVGADDLERIAAECGQWETDKFRVTVAGRLQPGGFHQCYAAPLVIHLGADGNVHFCHDQYGDPEYVIGRHHPKADKVATTVWGDKAHMNLLGADTPHWCDRDCSLGDYHRQARALVWESPDPLQQWQIIR